MSPAFLPLGLVSMMTAFAPEPAMANEPSGKFSVQGSTLIYNTEIARDGPDREITNDDVEEMRAALRDMPSARTLKITSGGGSVWAGGEMALVVMDFELNTVVDGECSSSCVTIFLAGARRSMTRGSKMGFHQRSWAPDATKSYYDKWRSDEGWDDPFDFASWVYQDTQTETYKDLTYMISRGVVPEFAIETKRLRSGTWFPTRAELLEAGVLTE